MLNNNDMNVVHFLKGVIIVYSRHCMKTNDYIKPHNTLYY